MNHFCNKFLISVRSCLIKYIYNISTSWKVKKKKTNLNQCTKVIPNRTLTHLKWVILTLLSVVYKIDDQSKLWTYLQPRAVSWVDVLGLMVIYWILNYSQDAIWALKFKGKESEIGDWCMHVIWMLRAWTSFRMHAW